MNYISLPGIVLFLENVYFLRVTNNSTNQRSWSIKSGIVHRRHYLIISAPVLCHNLFKKKIAWGDKTV